jgi:hypothetical protein
MSPCDREGGLSMADLVARSPIRAAALDPRGP